MSKKRSNGEGNFRQRSQKCWEGRLEVDGKSIRVYGKSKTEARKKLEEVKSQIANGEYVEKNGMTVSEWMDNWIECCTAKVKASTRDRYRQDIRIHIKPALGSIPLQELKTMTVQRFLNHCQVQKSLSEKSLKNIYLVLNRALTRAQKEGLIRYNPCVDAEIPAYETPQPEMRPLKDKEVGVFLRLIHGTRYEYLYYTAIFTGMRQSELIGLTWDCVDFDAGTIHLYRQYKAVRGKSNVYTFTTLKNKQSRTFKPPENVMAVLKKVKAKQAEQKLLLGKAYQNPENFVFTNEMGKHLSTKSVYDHFKEIVEQMGLPQVRFHDLRHPDVKQATKNNEHFNRISWSQENRYTIADNFILRFYQRKHPGG